MMEEFREMKGCVQFSLKSLVLPYVCEKTDYELKIVRDGWQLQMPLL